MEQAGKMNRSWQATLRHSWLNRMKKYLSVAHKNICPACRRQDSAKCGIGECNNDCDLFSDADYFYRRRKNYSDHTLILAQFCLEMYWKRGGKLYRRS